MLGVRHKLSTLEQETAWVRKVGEPKYNDTELDQGHFRVRFALLLHKSLNKVVYCRVTQINDTHYPTVNQ